MEMARVNIDILGIRELKWTGMGEFNWDDNYIMVQHEYIMRNTGMDETQAGIKVAWGNINNLGYSYDTTFMAKSEEELKSLLMKVKEESEKVHLKLNRLPAQVGCMRQVLGPGALGRPRGIG